MADLRDLAASMERLAKNIRDKVPEVKRRVAADALRLVILATPVGNSNIWREPDKAPVGYHGGRARNNWYVGLGNSPNTVTDEADPSGSTRISEGQQIIGGAGADVTIYLVNNLPYIEPLNDGHSHQAPAGFIEQAVARAAGNQASYKPLSDL